MQHIWIVEDDETIAHAVRDKLRQWGFEVRCAVDFQRIVEEFLEFVPHLVLLDVTLPYYDGYHWCREIRARSQVPIVFISSASENMNIVMAMQMGADDYLVKPFDLNVLEAKVRALLRRTYEFGSGTEWVEHGGVVLHLAEMRAVHGDRSVELTKNEFRILEALMTQKGEVLTRDDLMKKLWQSDAYIDDNTLTVNVTRLRKTLADIGVHDFIHTKKGVGYYALKE